jgi:ribokinase
MTEVAVVGSLHLDVVVRAARLPERDETLMGRAWAQRCGGKGGNQAVAAARAGARVAFLGAVGADGWGRTLVAHLEAAGVDAAGVITDPGRGSGMSVAIEDEAGDYAAVVVSGANLGIDPAAIAASPALRAARIVLLQNELPEAVNLAAARAAAGLVVLNAAPARAAAPELLARVGIVVVNRVEARMLTGLDHPEAALAALAARAPAVVLTLGAGGLWLAERGTAPVHLPVRPVAVVSTHGAGDAFCGALAATLARGEALRDACALARDAAGLFVSLP